ncbi:MAG: ATP-binding protein [Sedimentisphaerales bacterium]|nr:ATP-binding protein [Sedimentisphaerales bacterium]
MLLVQNMAIRNKLITIVMLTCLTTLLLVGGAFMFWQWTGLRNNMKEDLLTKAQITADNCKAALTFEDIEDAERTLKALKADSSILFGCVYKKSGEVFASYARTEDDKIRLATEVKEQGYLFSEGLLTVFQPIVLDNEAIGTVCLRSDLSPMYAALKRNAENTIAVLLLATVAAYLISSRLQRIISGPILALAQVAQDVSDKRDYSTRATKQSNDEVGLLIDAFNEMLEQIQQRDSELVKAKGELEVRVQERTAELTGANKQLTAEIGERKKAERKQAQLLKELESVNQELKDFAYIASHDLKAPLRAIKTLADWISSDYADKLDQDGQEQLKLLRQRVDRMHNLIDGILQYSRVGRVREKLVDVQLDKLLPEIIDILAPPAHIKIAVETELPAVKCEETRITQVFQNLLSNAVKYMDKPEGLIKVGCAEEGEFWKFSIADNGPGIEKKHWERIFKIFQTLAPRDEFESTGIGLTVVKKIVEQYSGRIWLESEFGQGTTFFFTFPKAGAPEPSAEEVAAAVAAEQDSDGSEGQNNES